MKPSGKSSLPLKIVQIIPALEAGGAERTVIDVSRALVRDGGQALTITTGGRLEAELAAAGGQIAYLPVASKNPVTLWRNAGRIAAVAKAFGAQAIHARSRAPAWSGRAAAQRLGIPFVTTYHGTYNARSTLKRRYNAIMASGDLVIANSHFIARHMACEHGTDPARIRVIGRGVDARFFDIAPTSGAMPDEPVIVLPGRLTRWKGQVLMIEALARLHQGGCRARLVLAGDDQGRHGYAGELRRQVATAGLTEQVEFCGHVQDMPALYAKADFVVSASLDPEAFGRVAVEAQASARLTLAAAHGGALETLEDGRTGFHFQPNDVDALVRVLLQALSLEAASREKICSAARARAARLYSCAAMCAKTLAVYRELCCLDPHP